MMERIVPLVLHRVRVVARAASWARREDAVARRMLRVFCRGGRRIGGGGKISLAAVVTCVEEEEGGAAGPTTERALAGRRATGCGSRLFRRRPDP